MMSDKFLYLIWKHPDTRRNYTVGKLTRGPSYKFEYCEEYSEAKENGLPLIDAFPNETQYESDKLFSVFQVAFQIQNGEILLPFCNIMD